MKFAKEIEEDLVPEWRAKYFDYKLGKKKIKQITRAVKNVQRTPGGSARIRPEHSRPGTDTSKTPILGSATGYGSFWNSQPVARPGSSSDEDEGDGLSGLPSAQQYSSNSVPQLSRPRPSANGSQPIDVNGRNDGSQENKEQYTRYGSIVGSPPSPMVSGGASLKLPGPAMDPDSQRNGTVRKTIEGDRRATMPRFRPTRQSAPAEAPVDGNAFEVGKTRHPFRHVSFSAMAGRSKSMQNVNGERERPLLKRIFSPKPDSQKPSTPGDMPMGAFKEIDNKQAAFFDFLDKELDKIETFYNEKEDEATHRLQVLRDQLHVMRDQRLEEIVQAQRRKEYRHSRGQNTMEGSEEVMQSQDDLVQNPEHIADLPHGMDILFHPIQAAKEIRFRRQPKHNNTLATPPSSAIDHNADYTRRPERPEVPYLTAKRKLKAALQEYYRGLELLKAFTLLNRTAFRKINKKYDKAVHARPTMRYMAERVSKANFVQSTVLDGHITAVEDLYARYFEKGNHKVAVNKLRKKNAKVGSYTGSVFRNGLFAAAGLVFGIEGIVYGGKLLFDDDPLLALNTSYLLQIYGGYFLLLYLFLFFCVDCLIFNSAKVNYVFIFEFDTRHNLDWRQMSEIPCFCLFLLGITMWFNFSGVWYDTMYLYYPVILIGLTTIFLFAPIPYIYHKSRGWFLYNCWRLLFAGAYPVEFRDFFLGDMFCSQTYAFGNLELFFCLYAHHWMNPTQCNSGSSRLLGFFTALPGIWRFLQCLRRYYDTRNFFPHLVNGGKYLATIGAAMSLSMYRIGKSSHLQAFFITISTINSIYTSIWDILMDWSLLDPNAPKPYLRTNLAYKHTWMYYVAMILDPILRFNWIFYAIFFHEVQHSAILSFFVGLSEVTRRGIWVIFRVENEHCTNVSRFRASRDVPLPYKLPSGDSDDESTHPDPVEAAVAAQAAGDFGDAKDGIAPMTPGISTKKNDDSTGLSSSADLERGQHPQSPSQMQSPAVASLRRRQKPFPPAQPQHTPSIRERFGNMLRGAHAQDFERRRKSEEDERGAAAVADRDGDDEDDEEEDAEEHAQDLETGGHGMEKEDTEEVGRRLGTPRTPGPSDVQRQASHSSSSRWREIAQGVTYSRAAGALAGGSIAAGREGDGAGAGRSGFGFGRHGSDRAVANDGDDEDVSPDGEGQEDGEEEYDTMDDRRDVMGVQALMKAARRGRPEGDE